MYYPLMKQPGILVSIIKRAGVLKVSQFSTVQRLRGNELPYYVRCQFLELRALQLFKEVLKSHFFVTLSEKPLKSSLGSTKNQHLEIFFLFMIMRGHMWKTLEAGGADNFLELNYLLHQIPLSSVIPFLPSLPFRSHRKIVQNH